MRNNNSAGVRRGYMCTTGTEETRQHSDVSVCVLSARSLSLKSFHLWNSTFLMVFLVLTAGVICFLPDQWCGWSTTLWVLANGLKHVYNTFPLAFVCPHLENRARTHMHLPNAHKHHFKQQQLQLLELSGFFSLSVWSPVLQLLSAPTKSPFPSSHSC